MWSLRLSSSYHAEERICSGKKCRHTVLLHDAQELDNNLGGWSDQNLTLSRLLGVIDGVERIVEN